METVKCGCRRLLVLVFVLGQFIQSDAYSWMSPSSICESSHPTGAWTGPAPALPTLPEQYSMKVEANLLQRSKSVEVEEHYDSINQRASVGITRNGTTIISIFNFTTNQRYDIYPNGTCNTRPSGIDYLGFAGTDTANKPVMATVNQVFRFGSWYNMTYIGKENVRGIDVNHWSSCQNWSQFGSKFQLDYYFSDPNFTTATGMTEIPVRAVLNGSAVNMDKSSGGQSQGMHTFLHSYEFISFRAGPVLNEEVFQIPQGVACSGRNDNKPLPPIPDQLEMSMEVVTPGGNKPAREEYLRYDYNHKLVETITNLVVTESMDVSNVKKGEVNADNDNLMAITGSVVRDYNNGLVYVTERINMTCTVRAMSSSTTNLTMAHGQNLLTVTNGDNKFMYQGQRTVRRMLVDVWAMEQNGISTEVYFMPKVRWHPFQSMIGMFIKNRTSSGKIDMPRIIQDVIQSEGKPWDETDGKDGSSPQSTQQPQKPHFTKITSDQLAWGLQLERVLDQHILHKTVNIFHYSPLHLDTTNFQVSQCYQEQEMNHVMLVIMADYYRDVLLNYIGFSNSLRNALAQKVGVSLLHISNLALTACKVDATNNVATKAVFTLLGAAPVQGTEQKSITQAKKDLLKAISLGITFHVQYFIHSKDFIVYNTMYVLDYNNYKSPTNKNSSLMDGPQEIDNASARPDSSDTRYSPNSVAGIAIGTLCLGAVLTVGVLFLLYKWKHIGHPLVPYEQSTC